MKTTTTLALWIYSLLLRLYPRRFRAEFGDEMRGVFAARLRAEQRQGHTGVALARVCLHEYGGLLVGLIRERRAAFHTGHPSTLGAIGRVLLLSLCGIVMLKRRTVAIYFCNLGSPTSPGIVNRIACGIHFRDPGGALVRLGGLIALLAAATVLVAVLARMAPRRRHVQRDRQSR